MQHFPRDDVELNLAPMLDVVLLLLCFFILTARFGAVPEPTNTLDLELPAASGQQLTPGALLIDLAVDGRVLFEGETFALSDALFAERLQARAAQNEDLVIRADAATPHSLVVKLMDLAGSLGYARLRVASRRQEN